jgi:hypothetical protein
LQQPEQINPKDLSVLVSTTVTHGHVDDLYANCHEELRVFNEREGYTKVEYKRQPAVLVENGRDEAVKHAIANRYHAVLQIDADMTFPPETFVRLLEDLFVRANGVDAVGAYCCLKGDPYLPTIDTGTGTWENWYPGSGLIEVIRTGAACLMLRTDPPFGPHRFGPPWFRARLANVPLAALRDTDNFIRCKMSGENRLYPSPVWQSALHAAKQGGIGEGGIGEDSGFCDRLKSVGGRILVDTDIACGHVGKQVIGHLEHKKSMKRREEIMRQAVGVSG